MRTDILKLLIKTTLALLPAIFVGAFSLATMTASGELTSLDRIIAKQAAAQQKTLYGAAYSDPDIYYKMNATLKRRPEVLILGTSRVLPFRAYLFNGVSFYNAGRGIRKMEDLKVFLEQLPTAASPKLLIVGLDQNFFNQRWADSVEGGIKPRFYQKPDRYKIYENNWAGLYKDYLKNKFRLRDVFYPDKTTLKIGLNAIANGDGFRTDGSYSYGEPVDNIHDPASPDYRFRDSLSKLKRGEGRFEFGSAVSEQMLKELEFFLAECRNRGIHVIGFLPAYSHAVYETLMGSEQHRYLHAITGKTKPLLESFGHDFYDFSDLAAVGGPDSETTDGLHGSEKAYLRIFLAMLKENAELQKYAASPEILRPFLSVSEKDLIEL